MVEVFKTNVKDSEQADRMVEAIHRSFVNCRANLDLEDCDKILRIESSSGHVESNSILHFLQEYGCKAQMLEDIVPAKLRDTEYAKSLSLVF